MFMAIDANMELVEEDGLVDIFGYMKKLRQARRGLVETMVTLEFIFLSNKINSRVNNLDNRSNTSLSTTH